MTNPEAAGNKIIFVDEYGRGAALVAKIRADFYAEQYGLSGISFSAEGINLPSRWGLKQDLQRAYDNLRFPHRPIESIPHPTIITPGRINTAEAIVCLYPEDRRYMKDLALRVPEANQEDIQNKIFLLGELAERIRLQKQDAEHVEQLTPPRGRLRSRWQSFRDRIFPKSDLEIKKEQILKIDQDVRTFVEHLSRTGQN